MSTILLAVILAAGASNDAIVGSDGFYSGVMTFSDPVLMESENGWYPIFDGAGLRYVPGEPIRPMVTLLVPVPSDAVPELVFAASGYLPTGLPGDQAVGPLVTGEGLTSSLVQVAPLSPPDVHAELTGVVPLAGCRFAVVNFYPVAGPDGSSYASRIRYRLSWDPAPGAIPAGRAGLASLVAPDGAMCWPSLRGSRAESPFWGRPWARICISATGGYRFSGQDLENAGCETVGAPSASLRLFTGPGLVFGESPESEHSLAEVAFTVEDQDQDGMFDLEDAVVFVGRGLDRWSLDAGTGLLVRLQHRYAEHNVYWLTWGGESGLRTGTVQGAPGSNPGWGPTIQLNEWFREQHVWAPYRETTTGWGWTPLAPGESFQVQCGISPPAGEGNLIVGVTMETYGSHTVSLWVNGSKVLTETWSGGGARELEASCDLSASNAVEIRYDHDSGDGGMILVDVTLRFPCLLPNASGRALFPSMEKTGRYRFSLAGAEPGTQVFDITDLDSPKLLTGTEYSGGSLDFSFDVDSTSVMLMMRPGDWMGPDSIATASPGRLMGTVSDGDRLIVVNPSMLDGVWAITSLASDQGHIPVVATTREIYDEFGQGVADPGAIRSAVRWGMDDWSPGLQGVLLAGDGHYDFLNHSTLTPVMIPVWIDLGSSNGACVEDNYVMVHQGAVLPEIPISRLPADNLSDLGVCNAKMLEYASGASIGAWSNRALIVADDEWGEGVWGDTEHTVNSERLAEEVIPRWIDREKFYLIEYPWPPGQWTADGPHPDKPEARAAFIETFSEGFGLMTYIGHGAAGQIAHEKMLLSSDIELLNNGARLPVILWGTCDVGRFDNPGTDAISEAMVLQPGGGSILSIAGTRGTYGGSNYLLLRAVTDSLYRRPDLSVGEAVWLAKLAQSGSYPLNNKYYMVLGHLDLPLMRPDSSGSVTIVGDTLRSGEINRFEGTSFQDLGLAFVTVLESSYQTVYTGLGGSQIEWLKYGGPAYRGTQAVEGGRFSLDCFIPIQSRTGEFARVGGVAIGGAVAICGAEDPAILVLGEPSGGDLVGPDVSMWIKGYEGVEEPQVTGDVTIQATLADSSGICILGGSGRALTLFIDGDGTDVGPWFTYDQGVTTSGSFTFTIEDAYSGEHELILWSIDGLGNGSRDTLQFRLLDAVDLDLTEVVVFPNPGNGPRCFSFRVTETSRVTITIYTVAGRRIDQMEAICEQGYNQILWDGLDMDGDTPATGSYIYRLEATATGLSVFDRTTEETGVLAVVREQGD